MTSNLLSTGQIPVAMAIIQHEEKYLMQLRDNIPGILYPGVWGLFGGHLDPGETPEAGLRRELIEEINFYVKDLTEVGCYADSRIMRYMFSCHLDVSLEELKLEEGWDLGLLTPEAIQKGYSYSEQAKQVRPLGDIHRQIMLDFIAAQA